MLTSMLLSQSLNYEGDVEEFVLQITRHRRLVRHAPLSRPFFAGRRQARRQSKTPARASTHLRVPFLRGSRTSVWPPCARGRAR